MAIGSVDILTIDITGLVKLGYRKGDVGFVEAEV